MRLYMFNKKIIQEYRNLRYLHTQRSFRTTVYILQDNFYDFIIFMMMILIILI